MHISFRYFAMRIWDTLGKRLCPNIYLCDSNEIPFMTPADDGSVISADIGNYDGAILHILWHIPSFGAVNIPTRCLPACDEPYNLNVELARGRLHFAHERLAAWMKKGYRASDTILQRFAEGERILSYCFDFEDEVVKARWGDAALAVLLPAAEDMALEYAQFGIDRRVNDGSLHDFRFGCNFFGHPEGGDRYDSLFLGLCNYATLPLYWGNYEPTPGDTDSAVAKVDEMIDFLKPRGVRLKGHPLAWFHQLPNWVKPELSIDEFRALVEKRITEIVTHFRGRLDVYDVINEVQQHTRYTREDGIELTRLCADLVKKLDPDATRIVNVNELFGEYMASAVYRKNAMHPFQYFDELERAGVDFDIIGIQCYHGTGWTFCRDLFEMSRYFDHYEKYGKPVQLSELGTPSAEGKDPRDSSNGQYSMFETRLPFRTSDAGFWHGPATERIQADWTEGVYRILMGKPFVTGVTWWDLSDKFDHFITFGGLVDEQMTPKESYNRLKALREKYIR